MREAWRVGGGVTGQECCPGISRALGRELSPAGVHSGTGQSVLSCYSLSLPLAGDSGKEGLVGAGRFLLRHIKSPSWGSSGQSPGACSAQPLVGELAAPDSQRSREGSRFMRSWLTADGTGCSPPLPILVGAPGWEAGLCTYPSGEGPDNQTVPVVSEHSLTLFPHP